MDGNFEKGIFVRHLRICPSMKKVILFMVFVLQLTTILLAQKPICSPVSKTKHVNYNLTGSDFNNIWLSELSYCPSGGYWAAGGATLKSNNEECLVVKFDDTGKLLLAKSLGTKFLDKVNSIQSLENGGCIVAASYKELLSPYSVGPAVLFKLDKYGNVIWSKKTPFLSNSDNDVAEFFDVHIDQDQNVFVVGNAGSQQKNTGYALAMMLDSNGNKIWATFIKLEKNGIINGIVKRDSIYSIVGYGVDSNIYNPVIMQITQSGRVHNCFDIRGFFNAQFYDIAISESNEIYALGKIIDTITNYGGKSFVVKMSSDGTIIWQKAIGYSDDLPSSIFIDDYQIWISSFSYRLNNGEGGQYIISIDTSGKVLSQVGFYKTDFNFTRASANRNVVRSHIGGLAFIGFEDYQYLGLSLLLTNPCQPSACAFNQLGDPVVKNFTYRKITNKTELIPFGSLTEFQLDVLDIPLVSKIRCNSGCIFNYKRILPKQLVLCANSNDSIFVNVQNYDNQYLWENGSVAPQRIFKTAGLFWVKTYNKCSSRIDTLVITGLNFPSISKIKDSLFCTKKMSHQIQLPSLPQTSITWENGDNTWIRIFTRPGKYSYTIQNSCGILRDTFTFNQDSAPISKVNKEILACEGQIQWVDGAQPNRNNYNYLWDDGSSNSMMRFDSTYTKILKTWNYCGSITDTVKVIFGNCDCYFYVPNAFTPQASFNKNDVWKPVFNCPIKNATFSIYSRWGECLLSKQPLDIAWDGKYQGEYVPDGIYIYSINGIYLDSINNYRQIKKNGVLMVLDGGK